MHAQGKRALGHTIGPDATVLQLTQAQFSSIRDTTEYQPRAESSEPSQSEQSFERPDRAGHRASGEASRRMALFGPSTSADAALSPGRA